MVVPLSIEMHNGLAQFYEVFYGALRSFAAFSRLLFLSTFFLCISWFTLNWTISLFDARNAIFSRPEKMQSIPLGIELIRCP